MWVGALFALGAGASWGLIFVAPELLHSYPPALLAFGRYVSFGIIALPLAFLDSDALKHLTRADWLEAHKLAFIGNIVYYTSLAAAIQYAGAAIPTMVIGTLPVIITIVSNWLSKNIWHKHLTKNTPVIFLPWRKLTPALSIMVLGIVLVHQAEWAASSGESQIMINRSRYILSLIFSGIALVCWTYYPIHNARWMQLNPQHRASTWATAQGLATLPLAVLGYVGFYVWISATQQDFILPFGIQPKLYISTVIILGLVASWLGTMFWNAASQRLPTQILGQLIVFEALSGLAFTYIWRGHMPSLQVVLGISCLVAGVLFTLRIKSKYKPVLEVSP